MLPSSPPAAANQRLPVSSTIADDKDVMQCKQELPRLHAAGASQYPAPGPHSPSACTPRKYVRLLLLVHDVMFKHQAKLSPEFVGALQVLQSVLVQAAQPYSASATGKLHYYLTEDQQLRQLQAAGSLVQQHLQAAAAAAAAAAAKPLATAEAGDEFQAEVFDLSEKLSGARCMLPANQLHLIDAFRSLCTNVNPAFDIPDGVQKAAEHVVREVIKEVHGPFFNSTILEQEVSYLMRIASGINPNTQRTQASTVKLLASTLLNLDGDESEDEEDFDVPGADSDPFLIPSFPSSVRVLDANGAVATVSTSEAKSRTCTPTGDGRVASICTVDTRHALVSRDMRSPRYSLDSPLQTTSRLLRGPFKPLDLDKVSGSYEGALDSPTPTSAALRRAAALEQQELQPQLANSWQQQQQQQQQQQLLQSSPANCWQRQQQQHKAYGLPPRSPRNRWQQQQQQQQHYQQHQQQIKPQQVPPLQLERVSGYTPGPHSAQEQRQVQQLQQQHSQQQQQQQQPVDAAERQTMGADDQLDSLLSAAGAAAGARAFLDTGAAAAAAYLQKAARRSEQQEVTQQRSQTPPPPPAAAAAAAGGTVGSQRPRQGLRDGPGDFRISTQHVAHDTKASLEGASDQESSPACPDPHSLHSPRADRHLQQQQQQEQQLSDQLLPPTLAHGSTSSSGGSSGIWLLREFLEGNVHGPCMARMNMREACTFHANLKLLDEGVEKLASFIESTKRVKGLSLAHNAIGPWGAQRLCKALLVHRTVQSLDLPDNAIGDAGAAAIAELLESGCRITSLQLSDNNITDAGMIRLAQAIQSNGRLEALSAYNNSIGSEGCRALTAAVAACRHLRVVEFLPGNSAATQDIKLLAQAVIRNRRFSLRKLFSNACMQP